MDSEIVVRFNYDVLDGETRIILKQKAERINERSRRMAQDIWETGRELAAAQEQLAKHGYGCFIEWAESETGYKKSTVYKIISVYRNLDCPPSGQSNLAPSVLYLLANPSTPPEVRDDMLEKAQAGEKVSKKDVEAATGFPKSAQTKKPAPKRTGSAFTASPASFDDFDQSNPYDDISRPAAGAGLAAHIAALEAAGYTVIPPDYDGPTCPYCGRRHH